MPTATATAEDSSSKMGQITHTTSRRGYKAILVKIFVKPGENQNPVCTKCLDDQKNAPWLGLTIVKGMERNGLDYEKNGTIVDPRNGSEFYGRMRLNPDGETLVVQGDLGIDPLGGDEAWRRLPNTALSRLDPALASNHVAASPAAKRGTTSSASGNSARR